MRRLRREREFDPFIPTQQNTLTARAESYVHTTRLSIILPDTINPLLEF